MTLADLQSAVARIASDPRCEPTLPIIVRGTGEVWKVAIVDNPRRVIIYCTP